jgi:aspartate 1-decarboxylase
MRRTFLASKIHRVTVTGTDVSYEGSLTLDASLLEAAHMLPYERVDVYDVDSGDRFSTYLIPGEPGSGVCCANGAAAHRTATGHRIIVAAYADLDEAEVEGHAPRVVLVDERNRVQRRSREILHGTRVG